jgi:hypothetical protein
MCYFHIISYIKVADMKAIISQMLCGFFCQQTAHRNVMLLFEKVGEMKCFYNVIYTDLKLLF